MAKKRRKRRNRMRLSTAVIRFLIGILLIALIVFAGFYLLFEVDYTPHLRNSDGTYASTRAYVLPTDGTTIAPLPVPTPTPEPSAAPTATPAPTPTPEPTPTPLIGITTLAPTATPDPAITAEPSPTDVPEATATATPVPTLVPTPTPVPTPEPDGTRIPEDAYSDYRTDLKVPRKYEDEGLNVGVSRCYVSRLNYYQVMQVNGWGYFDLPEYNGLTATTFALVTPVGEKDGRIYLCTNREGASRRIHEPEFAENAAAADFMVTIDTSDYATGEYELQLILQYVAEDKSRVFLCPFAEPHTFTVVDGEIVTPISID